MTKDNYIISYRIVFSGGGYQDKKLNASTLESAKSKINIAKQRGYKNISLNHIVIEYSVIKNDASKLLKNFYDFVLKSILAIMSFYFARELCNLIIIFAETNEGRILGIVLSIVVSLIFIIYEVILVLNALKKNIAEFRGSKKISEKKYTSEELLDL